MKRLQTKPLQIIKRLPLDLQLKVLNEYERLERLRNAMRHARITIENTFVCEVEHDRENWRETPFSIRASIRCDNDNMVWMTCTMHWGHWKGWSSDMYNVPLMRISSNTIKQVVSLFKKCYFEFIRFNYIYSVLSFKGKKHNQIKMTYYDCVQGKEMVRIPRHKERLSCKLLRTIIQRAWFNDDVIPTCSIAEECLKYDRFIHYANPQLACKEDYTLFRLDDTCYDLGTENIRVPYTHDDLSLLRANLPIVYQCLEANDQLSTPYRRLKPAMKSYVALCTAFERAQEQYRRIYGEVQFTGTLFHGFEGLPSKDEFNATVMHILRNKLRLTWYSHSYDMFTGYAVLMRISEVMELCKDI